MLASAVDEQTATTAEMSRNVAGAAGGSGMIATNITGVATAAQAMTESVADSREAAAQLSQLSRRLQELVGRFRV